MLRRLTVAIDDPSKRASHTLQVSDLALYVFKMAARHTVCIQARLIGVMGEREQFTNLIDGKAEFAPAPDERETFNEGIVVLPVPVARATCGRQ